MEVMNLQKKFIFISAVTFSILTGVLIIVLYLINTRSYSQLEQEHYTTHINRVTNVLDNKFIQMDRTAHDWAAWDDTYTFVQDSNEAYIESNLYSSVFVTLNLNFMIYFDSNRDLVWGGGYDLDKDWELEIPDDLLEQLANRSDIFSFPVELTSKSGFMIIDNVPLLYVARPIVKSDDSGPVIGTLIMARYLDTSEIQSLEKLSLLKIEYSLIDNNLPYDYQEALDTLNKNDSMTCLLFPDSNTVNGYYLINDNSNSPLLLLKITDDRDIHRQGVFATRLTIAGLIMITIIGSLFFILLLNSQILRRIGKLKEDLAKIRLSKNLSARVSDYGKDDIGQLAEMFNQTLQSIETNQHEISRKETDLSSINNKLQDINRHLIQRELRMAELKQQLEELESKQQQTKQIPRNWKDT
jgi:sensor domain CHASE-containing protein